jgi:hypothetical protein
MTKLLEKAFKEAEKLPEEEQDAVAKLLLDELASERSWDRSFSASQDALGDLADEALEEHREGRSKKLDPEKL